MRFYLLILLVFIFAPRLFSQCGGWIDPDSSHTIVEDEMWYYPPNCESSSTPPDEGSYGPIALPFTFQFQGMQADSVYIGVNGTLSLYECTSAFNPMDYPDYSRALAPFWADVDLRGDCFDCNFVTYKVTSTALYVTWDRVGYWPQQTTLTNTFQVIITDGIDPVVPEGNNVRFAYRDMQWATGNSQGGANGAGGVPATVGYNCWSPTETRYLQVGRFGDLGNVYFGPLDGMSGVSWLDSTHFDFNTADTLNTLPIFAWQFDCDTITVHVGETRELQVTVLASTPDQSVSVHSECGTLPSYTETANTSGEVAYVTSLLAPQTNDIGYHELNYMAYNDLEPQQLSTKTVVIQVVPGLSVGSPELAEMIISVSPNPATSSLRFVLPQGIRTPKVEVRAMDGRLLQRVRLPEGVFAGELDLQGLSSGTYLLSASGLVQRFVKY